MAHATMSPVLLIALTGRPGQGRTALLAQLAAEFRQTDRRVEGVLAVAEQRGAPDAGAQSYRLHLLGESQELPWAERLPEAAKDDAVPAYVFDPAAHRQLHLWAEGLRKKPPADLLLLDEFGKLEARGDGLMPLWPALVASAPAIAVLSVREHLVSEIEQRLGRRFDVKIAASEPEATARLRQACADFGEWTRLGLWGGAAGGIEVGAGSLLHGLRVPLRGLTLSSVQAGLLTVASAGLGQPGRVAWVALVSSGLKALSPGGNRIRPMVAITMQGLLFGGSVQLLGWNAAGLAVGGALIGTWAALQGYLLQYLLLGEELANTYARLVSWLETSWRITAPDLPVVLAAWAALHASAAAGAALVAWKWRNPPAVLQRVIDRELASLAIPAPEMKPRPASRWRRLAREMRRWQFWLPPVIVLGVLLASGSGWEPAAWVLVRFVGVGVVVLAILSLIQPRWIADWLRRRGWWGPAAAFAGALRRLKS